MACQIPKLSPVDDWSKDAEDIQKWWSTDRFKHTKRPFNASQVAAVRGTILEVPVSAFTSKKLYDMLRGYYAQGNYSHTFGALDAIQVTQMAKYLSTVYVSGWQCSSAGSIQPHEMGPDFADYPSSTVPNKVEQLVRAQLFHNRKQREERSRMTPAQRAAKPPVDYLRPIIADGDTGFGGVTSVMKLVKMHVLAGAAGIHLEDQGVGVKKCGHMGGKVLVPVREHVDRMSAARLQCDIMGVETVLVARTDAASATFLTSNIDPRDHPFILGSTVREAGHASDVNNESAWTKTAKLKTFGVAIADAMRNAGRSEAYVQEWLTASSTMPHYAARQKADFLGYGNVYWSWNAPRSREGYFRVNGCTEYGIMRALAFAPLSDLIWMETSTPDLHEADQFAKGVHAVFPHQMLAYNLSPSFNWSGVKGFGDDKIKEFQNELGKRGFVWQFITLAGFHLNALGTDLFARSYASDERVLAYVKLIQREEVKYGVETVTHQKWSGAELQDFVMMSATAGGASTASMQHGSTEAQFTASKL